MKKLLIAYLIAGVVVTCDVIAEAILSEKNALCITKTAEIAGKTLYAQLTTTK